MKWEYDTKDDIVALATPALSSAIGVIRTTGVHSIEKVARCFSRPQTLIQGAGGQFFYGKILHPETKKVLDEVVVSLSRAPKSYTGDDSVEISCHGSLPGLEAVLEALKAAGFRQAGPGEFTMRAFLNGKLDLTQAEAVAALIDSKTQNMHLNSLHALGGEVFQELTNLREMILRALAAVEVQLDYAEDDLDDSVEVPYELLEEVAKRLQSLLDSYRVSRLMREGVRIALAGRTNSGKSSLFNRLLRENRSIVSDVHGTTRDYLEETVSVEGIPVVLYDTAGLRLSQDSVENEGIQRTHQILEACDWVLYVLNAAEGETEADRQQLSQIQRPVIKIWNKIDIKSPPQNDDCALSALTGEGLETLIHRLSQLLRERGGSLEATFLITDRQQQLLQQAFTAIQRALKDECGTVLDGIAVELNDALEAIGELTGESASPDILEAIFSQFCVGK